MADDSNNEDTRTDEEKQQDAIASSNASRQDFDPDTADPGEKVVVLADGSSHLVKDLQDHEDPNIAADAKGVVEGTNPGGPNYPNGPSDSSQAAEVAPEPEYGGQVS